MDSYVQALFYSALFLCIRFSCRSPGQDLLDALLLFSMQKCDFCSFQFCARLYGSSMNVCVGSFGRCICSLQP